ncbi:DUF6286 domain-containing protein [Herbiconiux sp. CPCC 203407]|uniref:DUF6286 domain-containing protein n=1 Tax=Herbiconiux oxytropis TaxID=2970915 RepID=A0AA41XI05_9MICO|nr:DUF6286 domain-containing protein [Herbiconiux oxytropis]MCS5721654.1 DUF6286 domain-containing protein [Herbiconiux oxytropis]MCS5726719.1 DUF6286 domain-containing protein [Herbiconiux oxytropis]
MSTALTDPVADARPASSATTPTAPSSGGFTPPRGVYRRIARRETHSPRSMPAIVLAVALILVLAWIGTEIVIDLLGAPALLVAPVDMFTSAVNLVEAPAGIVAAAGIVVAVIGLALVVVAVSPGRRARHLIQSSRTVVVVDNEVIASALARHASLAGDVDPDNATVSVSHRRADVQLTPTSGIPVDPAVVKEDVARQLESYGLKPGVGARVRVAQTGRIGA